MKKKIALLLAAVMVVGSLPMTAFAATDNNVSKIKNVEVDDPIDATIVIDEFEGVVAGEEDQTIKLTLTNAEFRKDQFGTIGQVTFTKLSDTQAMAEFSTTDAVNGKINVTIAATAKGEGDATVTIEDVDSVVSSETLKIANVAGGATTTTISGTTSIKEVGTKIKNVVIEETTAGTLEAGKLKLRLTNGFKFTAEPAISDIVIFPTQGGVNGDLTVTKVERDNSNQDLLITLTGSSKTAVTVSIGGLYVMYDEDDVEVGDECEITVSNAGATKESIVIGSAADYGVAFTIYKDEELPVFYAGTYDSDKDTLQVKIKENIEGSFLTGRKSKIVFPDGVEVMGIDEKKLAGAGDVKYTIDENEVSFEVEQPNKDKIEIRAVFQLSVAPDFVGDITATLTGSAIGEDQTLTIGEAKFPVTVDADVNELIIDYRNTAASDIVITEAAAGVLKKDKVVALAIDGIAFDGDPTVEVESGDLKIKDVKISGDLLTFKIKTESQKEAGVIRISDIELYMSRSLPAGEYDLYFEASDEATVTDNVDMGDAEDATALSALSNDAIIRNFSADDDGETGAFDVDEVTVIDGYVTIVTAGRDQDDSTFTTKVSVTIGATTMMAGTTEIALDVPAYIANGYTMLPVRAVTEALSGSAIVRWDDATKTVTITFGQRVINMTVGSKTMVINGVNVAMQAACEITDSRAFIPLRDLGYALGLNDSKIAWDDATKTATLN